MFDNGCDINILFNNIKVTLPIKPNILSQQTINIDEIIHIPILNVEPNIVINIDIQINDQLDIEYKLANK